MSIREKKRDIKRKRNIYLKITDMNMFAENRESNYYRFIGQHSNEMSANKIKRTDSRCKEESS